MLTFVSSTCEFALAASFMACNEQCMCGIDKMINMTKMMNMMRNYRGQGENVILLLESRCSIVKSHSISLKMSLQPK